MENKTFKDLSPEDKIYSVQTGTMEIKEHNVTSVEKELVFISDHPLRYNRTGSASNTIPRKNENCFKLSESDHRKHIFFANGVDAIRYQKAQAFKRIRSMVDKLKIDLNQVFEFRKEHAELLSGSIPINDEILNLEKIIQRQ